MAESSVQEVVIDVSGTNVVEHNLARRCIATFGEVKGTSGGEDPAWAFTYHNQGKYVRIVGTPGARVRLHCVGSAIGTAPTDADAPALPS